ncbi:phosphopyruvate hydratase [candidate division WWE3 bacterium CG_4_9_14_0_2_um_filter_35_11]|uniref:Enolase n=1 Tax=candidate division WWE3 bacterium CG_4_9_14_0_2_um_filter_35_11 TaxID=1975077 RepID=A0A2M8EL93_UNCKA|nr:MAG: phosphopyruvate hydratase [candidate division WWE3 bacterium CG10_big_fil_rev_8_21_14_0_10_35_32]PJC23506.1 MAG: phosphopyruvate hydratase [candidate division WWE3 bacterium CG_4_9_14_0_2_um_filter_35_11]
MKIKSIFSRTILNSAGSLTIETRLELDGGFVGVASVPGGISKGKTEVASIDPVESVKRVGELSEKLTSREFDSQKEFDEFLIEIDGTLDKSNLGGNTMLSLSVAFCKACAKAEKLETYQYLHNIHNPEQLLSEAKFFMPQMMMLILEGGLHGSGGATIQEFMAIVETIGRGVEIYKSVKKELERLGQSTNVGAEGAFSPIGYDNEQILSLLNGYLHGEKIALDIAATSFAEAGWEAIDYDVVLGSYPIESIEDPFGEDDWANWEIFANKKLGNIKGKLMIVTDDLTTTNPVILEKAIALEVGNAILVKPNQIGTVTETLQVIKMAQNSTWKIVVSHRGTDTNDDFIADLAVGTGAEFVKFGAPARGERVAKYNRLLQIIF